MKTTLTRTALIAAAVVAHLAPLNAQDSLQLQKDSTSQGLLLKIDITSNDVILRDATVKVYRNNKFIAALNNKLQPEMSITLDRGTYYVIEVNKSDYLSKSLLISTILPDGPPQDENTSYEHEVSVSLERKLSARAKNPDSLIGILYYDSKRDRYIGSPMVNDASDKQAIIAQLENWLGQ